MKRWPRLWLLLSRSSARVVYSVLRKKCTSATKHKLLGTGNKKSEIVFAGAVGVCEIAGTKNIFLNQEFVVGVVSSAEF